LLTLEPDVVIVAVTHDQLAALSEAALSSGSHVLVEKPAGIGTRQVEHLAEVADNTGKLVKVGFNHRFHPAIARVAEEVLSGRHGELMHLRGRYGHGGRVGYDREWRAKLRRSGGGELVDQGMHMLDLIHWLAGPLPLHSALMRTHFWDTEVDDNAALILGRADDRSSPWAMLHVSWTEWKNTFSLEVYCRTAKLQVDGLVGSYGNQRLRVYRMSGELGPPEVDESEFSANDLSWSAEWEHFATAISSAAGHPSASYRLPKLLGDLADAHYGWATIEDAYGSSPPYAASRAKAGL
jgi:predicted dehydrogenase